MKKVLKNVTFVILLLKMCIIFGQENATQKRIIIDVGHGGKDSGAIGVNGIQEKDVVLEIANAILKLNNNLAKPLDIYLTRYNDTLISLSDRPKLSNALKAELFVSLHCNHSDNPNARGVEVYVSNKQSKYQDDSVWFAFRMQDALNKKLGFESRGVKSADFQVVRETISDCPSVLLELGFLSNWDESFYLGKPETLRTMALIILMELNNYLNAGL
ncbi:N-acetylmuramoyl-L-alanine amidase [Aequorivita sp. KMM 9714]|uniref:N-acetylmuramoyl-L-alanine amidase family protein n=1 Tax=Aequorivita sp. KMM 9714 TaxID=2707173 RepID=UPI0013EE3702|nr:N-acetylmuramoyl-L-alanine amidase [Aequorivita sp. KMM 9714]NGX82703.1 N-acetylmuramoyl-L-alanine amidase [Aequorivita sp. KMM 9714]